MYAATASGSRYLTGRPAASSCLTRVLLTVLGTCSVTVMMCSLQPHTTGADLCWVAVLMHSLQAHARRWRGARGCGNAQRCPSLPVPGEHPSGLTQQLLRVSAVPGDADHAMARQQHLRVLPHARLLHGCQQVRATQQHDAHGRLAAAAARRRGGGGGRRLRGWRGGRRGGGGCSCGRRRAWRTSAVAAAGCGRAVAAGALLVCRQLLGSAIQHLQATGRHGQDVRCGRCGPTNQATAVSSARW
jgi:hypothetical protein